MLLLIAAACFTLMVAYVIYVLFSSNGSEYANNAFDAFIDTSAESSGKTHSIEYSCNSLSATVIKF